MNDVAPDPVDVQAPVRALAWSPSRGFIDDVDDLLEAQGEGEVVLDVDDDRMVRDVEGDAPLAVSVRQDGQIVDLQRVCAGLVDRVNAGDAAT